MGEQLKIVVSNLPSWSRHRYRLLLIDPLGVTRDNCYYKSACNARRRIDRWRELGATVEESELEKIPIE